MAPGADELPTVRIAAAESLATREQWKKAQREDPALGWILEAKGEANGRPDWSKMTSTSPAVKTYWLLWGQ